MNDLRSSSCEASREQAQIGKKEPSCGAGDRGLEVLGEAAAAAKPGKGAFDHPSPGQELEAFDAWRALDDLDGPGTAVGHSGAQLRTAVDAIGEDVLPLGEGPAQAAQQKYGAVRVLDIGFMHARDEQEALGVGNDVALAPLDALAGIDAARTATFGGRHALAVDDAGRGSGVARPQPDGRP
jgi:hypothetical protein